MFNKLQSIFSGISSNLMALLPGRKKQNSDEILDLDSVHSLDGDPMAAFEVIEEENSNDDLAQFPVGGAPVRKWTAPPTFVQIPEDDDLYPLVELTAQKRQVDLLYASWHPLINFLATYRYKKIEEGDAASFLKVISGMEKCLEAIEDPELLAMFFRFFASRQGFILFRSSLLSLRYFVRMVPKLANSRSRFIGAFTALNEPALINAHGEYDRIIQMALTDEQLAHMDQDEIDQWTASLLF